MPAAKKQKTILVVDDNEDILALARAMFGAKGLRVLTATESFNAVQILKKEKVDVALIDKGLAHPAGNTFEDEDGAILAQAIKGEGDCPGICDGILKENRDAFVILSSGYAIPGGSTPGIDRHFLKGRGLPVDIVTDALSHRKKGPGPQP